jgi:hypothetical protein
MENYYWDCWLNLLDSLLLENGFNSIEERLHIKRARNVVEALNHIKSFYSAFFMPCAMEKKNHIETQHSSFSGVSGVTEWRVPGYPLQS